MHEHVTLMQPDARDPTARAISSGFPVDLLSQSAGRLRVLALLYAFVFFMAGVFPGYINLLNTYSDHRRLDASTRERLFQDVAELSETRFGRQITGEYLTTLYLAHRKN